MSPENERPELIEGQDYWYVVDDDKKTRFIRRCKLVKLHSDGKCSIKLTSWVGGLPSMGGPYSWTEMRDQRDLFYTKDGALYYYLKRMEEDILANTMEYEQEDQERAALYRSTPDPGLCIVVTEGPGIQIVNDVNIQRAYPRTELHH